MSGIIRERRLELGVGLRELARRVGASPSAIVRVEIGEPPVSVSVALLCAIADELALDADDVLAAYGKAPEDAIPRSAAEIKVCRAALAACAVFEPYDVLEIIETIE